MPTRHQRTATFHGVVVHGDVAYLAGMVADDKSLSAGGQTQQCLEKLDGLLRELGSDASHILTATLFVIDIDDKAEINEAWTAFFAAEHLPARATVGAAALGPGTLVEIVATAAIPAHKAF